MSLSAALTKIGLNNYEAEVYLALLRIGRSTAGPVIRETKFHRQVVYTSLERLIERGLVSFTIENNRKNFSPLPPDDLLRKEMERFQVFRSAIPDLKALQKKASNDLHVETFVGPSELFQSLLSAVDSASRSDGLLRILGGDRGSNLYNFLGSRYTDYVHYVYESGVSKRLITSPATMEQYRERFLKEPRAQLRLHDMGFSMPTYSLITQDLMDLCIMGEDIVVLRVWNKSIAKSYVEHFDLLWKLGKKIPTPRKRVLPPKRSAKGKPD